MSDPDTNTVREISVEKLVYGGRGLARIDGQVVLAPWVLPGETARVEVMRSRPGMLEAEPRDVIVRSPQRVAPGCPYFGTCGGCAYQHAAYEYQLEQKREILREVLARVGKLTPPGEIAMVSAAPWGYRNRSQFHIADKRIGYLEAGTHRLCPVTVCPISSPKINETLTTLIAMMRDRRFPRFVRSLELFTNESEVQVNVLETERPVAREFFDWSAERIPGANAGYIEYAAAGERFRVGYRSFFQVNRYLLDRLVETALEGAQGDSALDLYAGVGLFSLPLARRFRKVAAVEASAGAHRDLEFNAQRGGVAVDARHSGVEQFLALLDEAPDFVLADPPRVGLGRQVIRELLRLKPRLLTIVSCDPATLARDLAALVAGGYRIETMTLVDIFPQTWHLETITGLSMR